MSPRHPLSPVLPRAKVVAQPCCRASLLGRAPLSIAAVPLPRDTSPGHCHLPVLQRCYGGGMAMSPAPASRGLGELVLDTCSRRELRTGKRKSLASWGHSTGSAAPSRGSASGEGAGVPRRQM